jgi:hypothetical protein
MSKYTTTTASLRAITIDACLVKSKQLTVDKLDVSKGINIPISSISY